MAFGQSIRLGESTDRSAEEWNELLSRGLETAQDQLAAAAISRDPKRFATLLAGRVGVGGVYDMVRRVGAFLRGERFDASHGGERVLP